MLRALPAVLVAAVVVAAGSCATLRPECAAHGGDPWLELETEHFVMRTNLTQGEGRAAVLKLERWLAVVRHAFPSTASPPGRMEVVVFRDTRELQDLTGSTSTVGHQLRDWHGPLMLLGNTLYLFETQTEDAIVLHELTHFFERYAFARQPRWLAEGLASYFETAKVDETGAARTGDPLLRWLKVVHRGTHLPLAALWEWDADRSNPDDDVALTASRYASAWLFVHFLYNRREKQFMRWLQALAQGLEPRFAFQAAFEGRSLEQLDAEADEYVEGGKYRAHLFAIEPIREFVGERPVADSTAHALFARIAFALRYSETWRQRAAEELDAALALDPNDALALELKILMAQGEPMLEAARTLITTHPENPRGWRLAAAQLARAGDLEGALESLEKANSLVPDDPDVLRELGGLLEAAGRSGEALPMVVKAARLAPHRYELQLTLALMLARVSRCPEATMAFEHASELLGEKMDQRKFLERAGPYLDRCTGSPPPLPR